MFGFISSLKDYHSHQFFQLFVWISNTLKSFEPQLCPDSGDKYVLNIVKTKALLITVFTRTQIRGNQPKRVRKDNHLAVLGFCLLF